MLFYVIRSLPRGVCQLQLVAAYDSCLIKWGEIFLGDFFIKYQISPKTVQLILNPYSKDTEIIVLSDEYLIDIDLRVYAIWDLA